MTERRGTTGAVGRAQEAESGIGVEIGEEKGTRKEIAGGGGIRRETARRGGIGIGIGGLITITTAR